jgi:hypothetical protein
MQGQGPQARGQRDRRDALECRYGFMTRLEPVIRDSRAQVVNVVEADVAREPLQHAWQFVVRTALQRRIGEVPGFPARPVRALELMLDIEQPQACGTGNHQHGDLDEQELRRPHQPAHGYDGAQ